MHQGYHNAKAVVVFRVKSVFSNMGKDVMPMLAKSNVIYKCVCCCKSSYVGYNS